MSDDRFDGGDERVLMTAALLLSSQQSILGGMVRQVGTQTGVVLTPMVRHYTTAAVMLARHLVGTVDGAGESEARPLQLGDQEVAK